MTGKLRRLTLYKFQVDVIVMCLILDEIEPWTCHDMKLKEPYKLELKGILLKWKLVVPQAMTANEFPLPCLDFDKEIQGKEWLMAFCIGILSHKQG